MGVIEGETNSSHDGVVILDTKGRKDAERGKHRLRPDQRTKVGDIPREGKK